jgi:hypothetical protein
LFLNPAFPGIRDTKPFFLGHARFSKVSWSVRHWLPFSAKSKADLESFFVLSFKFQMKIKMCAKDKRSSLLCCGDSDFAKLIFNTDTGNQFYKHFATVSDGITVAK